jgi:hypothetical protein
MVSYAELFAYTTMIIALAALIVSITGKKK